MPESSEEPVASEGPAREGPPPEQRRPGGRRRGNGGAAGGGRGRDTPNGGDPAGADLVRLLRSGNVSPPQGCALLIDAHGDALLERCAALIGHSDLLATVLRDTLVVAYARIDRLADPAALRAWLLAVAEAECARHPREEGGGAGCSGAPHGDTGPAVGATGGGWPAELRLRVLSGIAAPELVGYRAHVAARAGSFDADGFPAAAAPAPAARPWSYLLPGLLIGLGALMLLLLVLAELAGLGPGFLPGGSARSAPLN